MKAATSEESDLVEPPLKVVIQCYLSFFVVIVFGHIRDFFGKIFLPAKYAYLKASNVCRN